MSVDVGILTFVFTPIASLVRTLRLQHGLRQTDFANRVGVSPATIATWEVGTRSPSKRNLARLADEFGLRLDGLLPKTKARRRVPPQVSPRGSAKVVQGSAWTLAGRLAPESINAVVTSPPYFRQRTYKKRGEFGHGTLDEYVRRLGDLFDLLNPALRPDAAVWLNIGDTVAGGQCLMVPARVALTLQQRGWLLRSEVIFERTNIAPESSGNRPTRSHEHVFLLARSKNHFWDADYMREPSKYGGYIYKRAPRVYGHGRRYVSGNTVGDPTRNMRSVWSGSTGWNAATKHPAVMPRLMAERCVLSITQVGDLVLDPFAGSGTTGLIAVEHGRNFLGWDVSREFVSGMRQRLRMTRSDRQMGMQS